MEPQLTLRDAVSAEDLDIVRQLFREHARTVGTNFCFQGFEEELAGLPGRYARPAGGLWLAASGSDIAGCIALRPVKDGGVCEVKRLFVRSAFRGRGIGRKLAEHLLSAAANAEHRRVVLDTMPDMVAAIALY